MSEGWRVGLLIPSSDSVMEVDFHRNLPHDSTTHVSRMYLGESTAAGYERMLDEFVMPAAQSLATVIPHIVVFGSPHAVITRGKDAEREICERLGRTCRAEAIGVVQATSQALREARVSRVALVTPYAAAENEAVTAAVEAEGIEVSAVHGLGLAEHEAASMSSEAIYSFVQSCIGPRVHGDALCLWGTNFRALGALSMLKITYDVPVVTSNLAAMQAVKRTLARLREREMVEKDQ